MNVYFGKRLTFLDISGVFSLWKDLSYGLLLKWLVTLIAEPEVVGSSSTQDNSLYDECEYLYCVSIINL